MEPTEDRPYVFRALDAAYLERLASAHVTLNEAMAAGEEARRRAPGPAEALRDREHVR